MLKRISIITIHSTLGKIFIFTVPVWMIPLVYIVEKLQYHNYLPIIEENSFKNILILLYLLVFVLGMRIDNKYSSEKLKSVNASWWEWIK